MIRFVKIQETFRPSQDTNTHFYDEIPVGTYLIDVDKNGYFLSIVDDFVLPEKIYGNSPKNCNKILNTFLSRETSTGVLLSGKKGSGKTLLAKQICVEGQIHHNIPTFIVNAPYCGDEFNVFLQSIKQPAIIVFDEFEKVYDEDHQTRLLTLFDGTFTTKKLFILTSNSTRGINPYLRDRPGRVRYWLEFNNLDGSFISEYCDDKLNDKSYTNQIVNLCEILGFNFDMLQALVNEMNMYYESPQEAMQLLNTKGTVQGWGDYKVHIREKLNPSKIIAETNFRGTPMEINTSFFIGNLEEEGEGEVYKSADYLKVCSNDLIECNFSIGNYTFEVNHDEKTYIVSIIKHEEITDYERAYAYAHK